MPHSVSNDGGNGGETPLGSISNTDAREAEAQEVPLVLAQLSGSRGKDTAPGISAPALLVRGTEPFNRSPGGFSPFETIIGAVDERVRILDTDHAPWRMICSLLIIGQGGKAAVGTGWFAGPKTIITAGHCVHDKVKLGGWAREIRIYPGRNSAKEPFAKLTSSRFSTTERWFTEKNPDFDYAAIHLDDSCRAVTEATGWFSTTVRNDAALLGQRVNISGYPGDKGTGQLQGSEQWFHAKQILHVTPERIFYDVDTMGGQSGAPVWLETDDGPQVVGVHAYGVGGASMLGLMANSAPRISESVLTVFKEWLAK
jgi:V8-like Glu-specific endopeptidase